MSLIPLLCISIICLFSTLALADDAVKPATPSDIAFKAWDDAQAKTATRFNDRDNQACVNAGFVPRNWGNPDTEKYYLCRARLIEERAPALPAGTNKAEKPRAATFFRQKAHEAQYAFRTIDEESHLSCMTKGGIPGEMDDPKTKLYYTCRAQLAEKQMGIKIALLFRQKIVEATNASADTENCIQRGFKREETAFSQCREKAATARRCLNNVPSKVEQKIKRDAIDCQQEARLKLPDQLTRGQNRTYTPAQLENARKQQTDICTRQHKDLASQYTAGLKLECKD